MSANLMSTVRNLQQRSGRRRRRLSIAEGIRLIEEALASNVPIRGVLATTKLGRSPRGRELLRDLASRAVPIEEVSEGQLGQVSDTQTSQGVLAVIRPPVWGLADIRLGHGPVLIVDGVQDPGNLGTLLRTAYALGAGGAILLKGTADSSNPKTLRAAVGASFQLPAAPAQLDELKGWARRQGATIWATATEGIPLHRCQPPDRLSLVVGSEAAGVSEGVLQLAADRVAIPLVRGAESLNVSVALGIVLYEVLRAR